MSKQESYWLFWPFAEGAILLSVTCLSFKTNILNFLGFRSEELQMLYAYDITVLGFCVFVVLISGIFNTDKILAVNNKLLYSRAFARVIAFIYVVYNIGAAFEAKSDMLFIIELGILLFLALITWIVGFNVLIEVMRRSIVHDDSESGSGDEVQMGESD